MPEEPAHVRDPHHQAEPRSQSGERRSHPAGVPRAAAAAARQTGTPGKTRPPWSCSR